MESLCSPSFQWNFHLKVLSSGSQGVNKARNLGLKSAQGKISFLMDDDCEVIDPAGFQKILSRHRKFPQALAIGGVYKTDDKAPPIDVAYNLLARAWQAHSRYGNHESSRLVGGNVSYKTKELLACGELFDESILFGGTESEFHYRLNRKGFQTLFFESLVVQHRTRLSLRELIHRAYCQAQTSRQYHIDSGYSEIDLKTHQEKRELWAFQRSKNWEAFYDILCFIKIYDLAYNTTSLFHGKKEKILSKSLVAERLLRIFK